jgi:phosphoenolpyruvate-protein kinase (PTS system EI component)
MYVSDPATARRITRALRHAVEFDPEAEPIEGVGAIRWLARRLGVTDAQFVALWRAAGG